MSKFRLFRYLKRWIYLIIALTVVGGTLMYSYVQSGQTYTAKVLLEYTNDTAVDGTSPNGKEIDVDDIYSAAVIAAVFDDLGLTGSIESVRSKCNVTPVIPEDEQTRKKALLDLGEEFTYFPTTYAITYTTDNAEGPNMARTIFDSIINNYFEYYSQNYISTASVPNNALNVSTEKYEFLECIELLDSSASEILSFLQICSNQNPYFRSSETGYTFADLADIYSRIIDFDVPRVYAMILDNRIARNGELLINRIQNRESNYTLGYNNLQQQINELQVLLNQYSLKSKEGIEYHYGKSSDTTVSSSGDTDYIIKNVTGDTENADIQNTTYDKLLLKHVDLIAERDSLTIQIEDCQRILSTFRGAPNANLQSDIVRRITESINQIIDIMTQHYAAIVATVQEQNNYATAHNVVTLTNISVSEGVNTRLYLMLAVLLFGLGGGGLAVLLGRASDFVEYYAYMDQRLGVPNRAKCDQQINHYSAHAIGSGIAFAVITQDGLIELNEKIGRTKADERLKWFAQTFLRLVGEDGFFGHTDGTRFYMLLEHSSIDDAQRIMRRFSEEDAIRAKAEENDPTRFSFGISESGADGIFNIRELLSTGISRLSPSPYAIPEKER